MANLDIPRPPLTREWPKPEGERVQAFDLYRYDPESDEGPRVERFWLDLDRCGPMLLDALALIREIDPTLSYRRSCAEGVCGSCAMNIDGRNGLACSTHVELRDHPITIFPLPNRPVIRDLVVDLSHLYEQYASIEPWLKNSDGLTPADGERPQSPEEREELEGLWECILCFCCQTSCPSYWWNEEENFLGPALLLQAERWLADSRDTAGDARLKKLTEGKQLYACRTILNCTAACPKGLDPGRAVAQIKRRTL